MLRLIAANQQAIFSNELYRLFFALAAFSIIVPGILALDQQRVGRMCVYLLFIQPGLVLSAGLLLPDGIQAQPGTFFMIFANIAIVSPGVISGITFWKHATKADKTWEDYAGAGRKHPFVACAWLCSLASLIGLPGTLGFSIRAAVIQQAFLTNQLLMGFLIASAIVIGAIPVIRLAIFLFGKPIHFELARYHRPRQAWLICLCGVAAVISGLVPSLVPALFTP
jgi:NADH-quinone oxidoreductase subunit N